MKPALALHRSILFWSGILVMIFIGWAWWASLRGASYVGKGRWQVSNTVSGVIIESRQSSSFFSMIMGNGVYGGYQEPHALAFPIELLPAPRWVRGKAERGLASPEWECDPAPPPAEPPGVSRRTAVARCTG